MAEWVSSFFCGQNEAEKYKHELENIFFFFVYSYGWITIYERARVWIDFGTVCVWNSVDSFASNRCHLFKLWLIPSF